MTNIKSKKGITLVSLVITVIVLLILSGTAIYNSKSTKSVEKYNKMVADIELLNDKILVYYNKYGEVPITDRIWERNIEEVGNIKYYEIDLSKLEGITLNYGNDYGQTEELTEDSDVYLINSNLHIYYLRGVETARDIQHFINDNENYAPNIKEIRLPEGYIELEYIESTGTQYIDTGYINSSNNNPSSVELDFQLTTISNSTTSLYGSIKTSSNNYPNQFGKSSSRYWYLAHYGQNGISAYSSIEADIERHIIRFTFGEGLYLDNTLIITETASTTSNSGLSCYLFGRNRQNVFDAPVEMNLYRAKIWENKTTLVRDFIPCYRKSDNEVGMYDTVNDVFYTNQGTGEFIAGPEV